MHTPTLYEELNRKTLEALAWMVGEHDSGKMTDAELYAARQALFTTVSGLVDSDISALMFQDALSEDKQPVVSSVLQSGKTVLLFRHRRGEAEVRVTKIEVVGTKHYRKTFAGPMAADEAAEWMQTKINDYTNNGFQIY